MYNFLPYFSSQNLKTFNLFCKCCKKKTEAENKIQRKMVGNLTVKKMQTSVCKQFKEHIET